MMNTICFAMICKNNEKNIVEKLEKIYKITDYWVILDTGSTDNTVKLIIDFFKEKNIQGEIIYSDSERIDVHKKKLFEASYKKTDFILHIDIDDEIYLPKEIVDNNTFHIVLGLDHKNIIGYNAIVYEKNEIIDYKVSNIEESKIFTKERKILHKKTILFNNHYKWIYVGIYNPKMICINTDELEYAYITMNEFYIYKDNHTYDDKQLNHIIEILEKQMDDTLVVDDYNLYTSSIFEIAKLYYDNQKWKNALDWYLLYTKYSNVDNDKLYESYIKIGQLLHIFDYSIDIIIQYFVLATRIYNERAEAYYYMGRIFIDYSNYDMGFYNLKKADMKNYETVLQDYSSFIDEECYNGVNELLLLCCKYTGRNEESKKNTYIETEYTDNITKVVRD